MSVANYTVKGKNRRSKLTHVETSNTFAFGKLASFIKWTFAGGFVPIHMGWASSSSMCPKKIGGAIRTATIRRRLSFPTVCAPQ
jgi:hypothetical protein